MSDEVTRITGGSVMFEDATKIDAGGDPQYWPTRRARVELTFNIGPDEDETFTDAVIDAARKRVSNMLGTTAPAAVTAGETSAPTTRKRRTQAEIAVDNAAALAAKAASASAPPSGGESGDAVTSAADPAAIVDETSGGDPTVVEPEASGDPAGMDDWESPPAEVTDADLNSAVQKKNGTLGDPPKIRALIGSYNPDPTKSFQLREIPQASRAEFLAKLEALK